MADEAPDATIEDRKYKIGDVTILSPGFLNDDGEFSQDGESLALIEKWLDDVKAGKEV
jgi:hypothetical protein